MKVEGIGPAAAAATQLPAASVPARVPNGEQASTPSVVQDRTSFHSDSNSIQTLTGQALSSPEIRQGTVNTLRDSVNSGQYQVDASRIATAISNSFGSQ